MDMPIWSLRQNFFSGSGTVVRVQQIFGGSGTQKGAENENVSEIALPPLGTRREIRVEMLRAAIS